jgi:hypothetical protein
VEMKINKKSLTSPDISDNNNYYEGNFPGREADH